MGHFHPVLVKMNFIHLGWVGGFPSPEGNLGVPSTRETQSFPGGRRHLEAGHGNAGGLRGKGGVSRGFNLPMDDFDTSMYISLIYLEGDR